MTTRRAAVTVAACAALGGVAGCGPDGPDARSAELASTSAPRLDTDAAIAAAVDVRADGCASLVGFGTGSVIDNGDIVTAAHVVAGATSIDVIAVDGATSPASVIVFDPDLDLAVLRPEQPVGSSQPMRTDGARRDETGIVVLPRQVDDAVEVELANVRVVRTANITTTDIYLVDEVVRDGYEIEGSIDPGDSGAMVVLPGGGAGIVWARSNRNAQRAWAIDLPANIIDLSALDGPRSPVDIGPCL